MTQFISDLRRLSLQVRATFPPPNKLLTRIYTGHWSPLSTAYRAPNLLGILELHTKRAVRASGSQVNNAKLSHSRSSLISAVIGQSCEMLFLHQPLQD